jgi:hypothetical protein
MRLIFAATIGAFLTHGASAQDNAKPDPMTEPNAEMSAEAEFMMNLQDFTKKMEEAGFKDIQISQALILEAKDKSGKPVRLLVNPTTGVGVELKASPDRETTGSGSSEDDK